jgi:hypothetical protein
MHYLITGHGSKIEDELKNLTATESDNPCALYWLLMSVVPTEIKILIQTSDETNVNNV